MGLSLDGVFVTILCACPLPSGGLVAATNRPGLVAATPRPTAAANGFALSGQAQSMVTKTPSNDKPMTLAGTTYIDSVEYIPAAYLTKAWQAQWRGNTTGELIIPAGPTT